MSPSFLSPYTLVQSLTMFLTLATRCTTFVLICTSAVSALVAPIAPRSTLPIISSESRAPAPTERPSKDALRRRQSAIPDYICGYSDGYSLTCNDGYRCTGILLPNGAGYQYCSGVDFAPLYTTAYAAGVFSGECPNSALCWYVFLSRITAQVGSGLTMCSAATIPGVQENLFESDGYTATGWGCADAATVAVWSPAPNVLVPASFSKALGNLGGHSAQSGTTLPPTSSPATSAPDTTSSLSSTSTQKSNESKPATASQKSSGGFTENDKIALGCGIGIGLPGTLATIWVCLRGKQRLSP